VRVLSPETLASIPCPSYPEIRLALNPGAYVARELKAQVAAALRATLAVSRSSVMIARMTARPTARRLTE
jgi:hypothetical protein